MDEKLLFGNIGCFYDVNEEFLCKYLNKSNGNKNKLLDIFCFKPFEYVLVARKILLGLTCPKVYVAVQQVCQIFSAS